jgi:hypothetical protein
MWARLGPAQLVTKAQCGIFSNAFYAVIVPPEDDRTGVHGYGPPVDDTGKRPQAGARRDKQIPTSHVSGSSVKRVRIEEWVAVR